MYSEKKRSAASACAGDATPTGTANPTRPATQPTAAIADPQYGAGPGRYGGWRWDWVGLVCDQCAVRPKAQSERDHRPVERPVATGRRLRCGARGVACLPGSGTHLRSSAVIAERLLDARYSRRGSGRRLHFGATGAKMAPCLVCRSKTCPTIRTGFYGNVQHGHTSRYRNICGAVSSPMQASRPWRKSSPARRDARVAACRSTMR